MEISNYFFTILTILLFISHANPTSASKVPQTYTSFIKKSCNTTTYPTLCVKTLYPYASTVKTNSIRLCNAALLVAIQSTGNCSTTVLKLASGKNISRPDASALKNCIGDLKDAVYELRQTVSAMRHLRDADKEFQWDNAKTYASAAITDAETCIDEVSDRRVNQNVMNKIRDCVSGVEKHISNALSLINHLY
ncbi:Pectinesterase [Handroanthus impetiginosus]|uniref:Pectinesterase n=1 Tax=Handroanthus impetiginosus TaxID=429701 RepID=A0A2G9HCM8_9LAMI|nr:Pectinesterase [Handroanthus impetiginosus]